MKSRTDEEETAKTSLQMYLVYRMKNYSFGWMKVTFNDMEGIQKCGLWYAPIETREMSAGPPEQTYEGIQQLAKMAVVCIPYNTALANLKDGDKARTKHHYCVITNYWKERDKNGRYVLPRLDTGLYGMLETNDNDDDVDESHVI